MNNTHIQLSPFNSLPIVQFTNNHNTPPTREVIVCQDAATADQTAATLRTYTRISEVSVYDAAVKLAAKNRD